MTDWILLVSLTAVTLQLFRLAVDLIQVASQQPPAKEETKEKEEDDQECDPKNNKEEQEPENGTSDTKPGLVAAAAAAAYQYGSMVSPMKAFSPSEKAVLREQTSVPTDEDEEGQPLLTSEKKEEDGGTPTAATTTPSYRACRVYTYLAGWSLLTIVFGVLDWRWIRCSSNADLKLQTLTTASWMVCGIQVLLQGRDWAQARYGGFSKTLLWTTVWLLWGTAATLTGQVPSRNHYLVWSLWTVALLLTLAASWFPPGIPLPPPPEADKKDDAAASKKGLSQAAMWTLLQPYFWPSLDVYACQRREVLWNRVRAVSTWICVFGSKACGVVSPLLLGWATTALAHQDWRSTISYAIGYSVLRTLQSILKEGQSLVYLKVAQAAFVQLSETSFGHLHTLSLDWHLRKKLGEVLRSMTRGIAACDTLMKYLFLWLVPAMAECLTVCLIFATYFAYLPLAVTVFYFVFVYVVWTILVTLWRKKFRKELVQSDNEWNDLFTDSLINFETVKFFTAEDYEKRRFGQAVHRYQAGSVNVQSSLSFLNISQQVILQTCLATSLSLAVLGIRQRMMCCVDTMGCPDGLSDCCQAVSTADCPGMQVGDFVAVLTYTVNLFQPLNFLGSVYNAVVMAFIDLNNLSELLAENPDVVDAPDAVTLPSYNVVEPEVAVEFDNVTFHYPTQNESQGLHQLSFKMKRGTTTAIVGPTGAGKTTISRLFFRFYDVLGGAVRVNGMDVRSVTQKSLRGAIGVVPQSASMFNDTIRYNLLYGRVDASQDELVQAAQDAQLMDFVNSLENGWETMVGDRGLKLSGGEKQRAAIARCLLKNPPFVLLDEATSALDSLTENSVQEALDRLGKERTVLVIAHRLGTIRNADNIIVLKDGRVFEEGNHDQLMKKNGVYAEMWNMQLHSSNSRSNLLS